MTDFHGDEAKIYIFFFEKKNQNGQLKKTAFFKIANSQFFFFCKFHGLVLGFVQLIDAKGIDVAIWS